MVDIGERVPAPRSGTGAAPPAGPVPPPPIALPKGGGAIRGIGETFAANPVTGTATMTVPIATSPGRAGFGPQLALNYDAGAGNGPFGFGWTLPLPAITRKTEKGLPRYDETDVFLLSGTEDLVPAYRRDASGDLVRDARGRPVVHEDEVDGYRVRRYRPRVEGAHARIERWCRIGAPADVHWRSISGDNVLTLYGLTPHSRVCDPADPRRVFSWLVCETRDDRGNAVLYRYVAEDGAGADLGASHQRNRGPHDDPRRGANRYLKRVHYGNRASLLDGDAERPKFLDADEVDGQVRRRDWMFEVVFDYGEHDDDAPHPDDAAPWAHRSDAFSSYRSGFEIRTARRCRRVLMFHHFPADPAVGQCCLVRSTDFTYAAGGDAGYSFLRTVTQTGYTRTSGGYAHRSVPPLELDYAEPLVGDVVRDVDADSLDNLPVGLDGGAYQWTDLHGEGIPGILTEQAGAWFYKPNLSPLTAAAGSGAAPRARFGPLETVAAKPQAALARGAQVMDLAGDGLPDLVETGGPVPGFYEHDDAAGWQPFRPFQARLTADFGDPNLRLVDLDGDGRADVLRTEGDALTWHLALGEAGFGPAHRMPAPENEERGPRVLFADGTGSVQLADLTGDGLSDLVRIRNGEVCYWPNFGYGRFGVKVTMDGGPWFDHPDLFDPARVRLIDIDGTGTTDLVYLHRDGPRLYFNRSGNAWGPAEPLTAFAPLDDVVAVTAVDLLGNGTACLVWSSPQSGDGRRPMRYVDLMGGRKPHLLTRVANNLGAETQVTHAPSTAYYLEDARAGRPWSTRLPFPVHVVARVDSIDHVSRNRFTTRYAYHDGCFDGVEREFRGFGMVEQWDTERIPAAVPGDVPYAPPVLTRTWFHTGVRMSGAAERERFREPRPDGAPTHDLPLPDTALPAGLTVDEEREAYRALKGAMLRQEVYALDGSAAQPFPYTVVEQNHAVRLLQPREGQPHAVLTTHPGETLTYEYERDPSDPRVRHVLTLEVDDYGNVLKEATVGYGRRRTVHECGADGQWHTRPNPGLAALSDAERPQQTTPIVTYTENLVTEPIDAGDARRNPLPADSRTYELTGFAFAGPAGRCAVADLVEPDPARPGRLRLRQSTEVAYEAAPVAGACRRTVEWRRTLYRRDDLAALLLLGRAGTRAQAGESYQLAFTRGLLDTVLRRPHAGAPDEALLPDPAAVLGGQGPSQGGYRAGRALVDDGLFPSTDPDSLWWRPSGRVYFTAAHTDSAAVELAAARDRFFQPHRHRDPFGHDALVALDGNQLLPVATTDALGNRVSVDANDYRVLQPRVVSDPNRNRTAVVYDALGAAAGTAVMGKATGPAEGDALTGLLADPSPAQVAALFDAADPAAPAAALLAAATSRVVYDLDRFRRTRSAHPDDPDRWEPPCAATIARETHGGGARVQVAVVHHDGYGREVQKKTQAERLAAATPRWVGTGWTVYDNKGQPVRRYEPFFSATHRFEFAVLAGVSSVTFYDPAGRAVATLHPNDTYEKVAFDAWQQTVHDANDTCAARGAATGDPRTDADMGGYVSGYFAATDPAGTWKTWYARRATGALGLPEADAASRAGAHADTPTTAHLDALGRTFLTVNRDRVVCAGHPLDGTETSARTRVALDVEGNVRAVRDPLDRVVAENAFDVLGNRIRYSTVDGGTRWMLADAAGGPIRAWDDRGHDRATAYDVLRRLTEVSVCGTTDRCDPRTRGRTAVVERIEYGESVTGAEALNLRTRVYRHFDGAGVAVNARLQSDGTPAEAFDFKGNVLHTTRRLCADHAALPDWSQSPVLNAETFAQRTRYDALNRAVQSVAVHGDAARSRRAVVQRVFNVANLLERVDVWLDRAAEPAGLIDPGVETPSPVGVDAVEYDAAGRRLRVDHRNGVVISYRYDYATFRLAQLYTRRGPAFDEDADNPQPPPPLTAAPDLPTPSLRSGVQNLSYTYDPVGNITHIVDAAQQTVFFRNKRVEASNDYVYDALYRLVQATGREHLGQTGAVLDPPTPPGARNAFHIGLEHPADGDAMGTYLERYVYDVVGNVMRVEHRGTDPRHAGWTRAYDYAAGTNRLTRTTLNPAAPQPTVEPVAHDAHGNVSYLSHLGGAHPGPNLHWDHRDRLRGLDLTGGGTVTYVYDAAGDRVRKVWEKAAGVVQERIYLPGFELYREHRAAPGAPYDASTAVLEREMLHVADDRSRIALVETRTLDVDGTDRAPERVIRYQYGNHLGSASLELDDRAQVITYEEYAPFGSSTFQSVRSQVETPKRYRFSGKERDEESGFAYYGARYYMPWLGRWASCDPAAPDAAPADPSLAQPYLYVENKPVAATDPDGAAINLIAAVVGAGVGALIGGAMEAGRQYLTTGKVSDWKAVGASAAGGAVSGALAGLTMGASLGVTAGLAVAAGTSVAGGAVTRAVKGEQQTVGAVLTDAAIGVATFGLVKGGSTVVKAMRSAFTGAGTKAAVKQAVTSGVSAATKTGTKEATTAATQAATKAAVPAAATAEASAVKSAATQAAESLPVAPAAPTAPGAGTVAAEGVREAAADAAAPAAMSESVARVQLIDKMQKIVQESADIADDAIARGDRGVLEQFLTNREVNRLLQGGRLSQAFRGVFVEWRSRMMFALDEAIQPHVGRGGFVGLRGAVVNGQWRRGFADFFGTQNGMLSNIAIDITTKAGYAKHIVRGYLEKGLILTY
ncbi:MAG TPA: SpvB/TcaC N-terminal domain-containing protein [Trebonia sp.]|jgi:RHS repeat-associated protein